MKTQNLMRLLFKLRIYIINILLVLIIIYLILLNYQNAKKVKMAHKGILSGENFDSKKKQIEIESTETYTQSHTNKLTKPPNSVRLYPDLFKCKNYYDNSILNETIRNDYRIEADKSLHDKEIVRGVIIYFPIKKFQSFIDEFKWLYRSWIEMQKYEPVLWRTDLIIFMDVSLSIKMNKTDLFQKLNCTIENLRFLSKDSPMCTIRDYVSINNRNISTLNLTLLNSMSSMETYSHLFRDIDVFNQNENYSHADYFWLFYKKLKDLQHYSYIDSILMAFDGYTYFQNKFNFLLRSDIDVFLTPLFAKWLPLNCFDFIVGGGAYTHDFNIKRLQKAAKNIELQPGAVRNLGLFFALF